jgi:hypothetical protein
LGGGPLSDLTVEGSIRLSAEGTIRLSAEGTIRLSAEGCRCPLMQTLVDLAGKEEVPLVINYLPSSSKDCLDLLQLS